MAKAHAENVANLRLRVAELVKCGLIGADHDMYVATLIQLLNEAESQRQKHMAEAQRLRKQAEREEGQAEGCSAMTSVILNTVNAFINKATQTYEEELRRQEEEKEKQEYLQTKLAKKKTTKKKKVTKKNG